MEGEDGWSGRAVKKMLQKENTVEADHMRNEEGALCEEVANDVWMDVKAKPTDYVVFDDGGQDVYVKIQ